MNVAGIDERHLGGERTGADFILFIYEGGDAKHYSWSVDSYLLTDADVPGILSWLETRLPVNCCWSLGVVLAPERPTTHTDVDVAWIVGADVLNDNPRDLTVAEQRAAEEMLARRHRVTLLP
jgi:hypothetical protein